ncbi:alcohol dehydrogenase [Kalaharituber pfeilii]|nr:alcohol dehydrogenase [Kalaharituber pfeilii]
MNTAANITERVLRPGQEGASAPAQGPDVTTDISNPARDTSKYADPSGETMKAVVWQGANKVELVETNKPKIVDGGDVILKVTGSSICGSDLHLYHGSIIQLQKGDILGHEFCGKVESVGADVRDLQPGDRVVASFHIACGRCRYCQEGLTTMCDKTSGSEVQNTLHGSRLAGTFGYSHLMGGFAGGQAEYVRVPYADMNLLKLPQDVPDEKGLYLSDVLGTAYHCVKDTGINKGNTVAIWGMGPIGLFVAVFAFKAGASRVIAVDNNWRLAYAKSKIPNLEILDYSTVPAKKGVSGAINELVPGGVDVALECAAGEYPKGWLHAAEMALGLETDTSEILNEMILSVRKFGRCGITGVYAGFTNHFNIGALMERGVRLIGNGQAPIQKYWKDLLKMIQNNEIDPLMTLTHRISLEDVPTAYTKYDKKLEGIVKVFVETKFSDPPSAGAPRLAQLAQ